jgi:DDE superfamily endonuclease
VAVAVIVDQAQQGLLTRFRQGWYGCLGRRADGLFELTDALLCAPGPVGSLPQLSLEPGFRRGWGSLYGALAEGEVAAEAIRDLLTAYRPVGWPLVFAVDQTTWPRCDAECSPARGLYYHPSRHSAGQPIVAGWAYQWVCQLGWEHDSWTAPVDARRILPTADPVQATVGQARALAQRLGGGAAPTAATAIPLLVFDAGYDPIALTCGLAQAGVRVAVLVRIRSDRVFYTDPPGGRPGPPAGPAGTAGGSPCRIRRAGQHQTTSSPSATPATDRSRWQRGRGCTPNCGPAGGSRTPPSHRSCAAPSSGSRSAGCPSPPAGSRSCGCGGQARERRT